MANPRRSSHSNSENPFQVQNISSSSSRLSSVKLFLRKPHAFPFLLSVFLFITWLALRLQRSSSSSSFNLQPTEEDYKNANLIRFKSGFFPSPISKDKRGWLLDPLSLALHSGITGGAVSCASVHVGEIRPGSFRGNHRHHTCNETFVIWGAKTLFRLENKNIVDKGYAEVIIGANEVAVAASPTGTAHLILNVDSLHTTYLLGCQDNVVNYNGSTTDFNVWKDF